MNSIEMLFEGANDTVRNKAKGRMDSLANWLARDAAEISRIVGREEVSLGAEGISGFVGELSETIEMWRKGREA
jgi:hypothetical protein